MEILKDIIKLVLAHRRNPYLYFSGLLVTLGCFLLTPGLIEILLGFAYKIVYPNKEGLVLSSSLSSTFGVILVVSGMFLFYLKFLKKKVLSEEYEKDSELIKKIFFEITTLDKLDMFIDKALYPYLYDPVLEDFESFRFFKTSSHYHVYDDNLKCLVEKFYNSWGAIYSYYESFTETANHDILRPATVMDIATRDDVRVAIEKVPEAARLMHEHQMNLLEYIRNNFRDIEI